MADIYSAAHLVIVAANAPHADHGLENINTTSPCVQPEIWLGSVRLMLGKLDNNMWPGELWPWSRRGWTFQECYFAKRRLFLTNMDTYFVCNRTTGAKELTEIRAIFPPMQQDPPSMQACKCLVQGYAGRQLTYESDTLPAITGAWNNLRKQGPAHHLWGLPLDKGAGDWDKDASLALLWRNVKPCKRRHTLPSWTAMAWSFDSTTAEIDWIVHHDISLQQLHVRHDPASTIDVTWAALCNIHDPHDAPRYLEIKSKMVDLKLVDRLNVEGPYSYRRRYLLLPLDEDLEIVVAPSWDVELEESSEQAVLIGILFTFGVKDRTLTPLDRPVILVIQQRAGYYERVGIMCLQSSTVGWKNFHVLHEARYLMFRQKSTEKVAREAWDTKSDPALDELIWNKYDWQRFFKDGTIILG